MSAGWIGVDLDGTLAHYEGFVEGAPIGEPIPVMAERVRAWISSRQEVRIFTARAFSPADVALIQDWTEHHLGARLPVTDRKDIHMRELWDDRAIQVVPNTGLRADGLA